MTATDVLSSVRFDDYLLLKLVDWESDVFMIPLSDTCNETCLSVRKMFRRLNSVNVYLSLGNKFQLQHFLEENFET